MWPTYSVEELMVLGHILRDQALLKADESHLTAPCAAKIQGCQKFMSFINHKSLFYHGDGPILCLNRRLGFVLIFSEIFIF